MIIFDTNIDVNAKTVVYKKRTTRRTTYRPSTRYSGYHRSDVNVYVEPTPSYTYHDYGGGHHYTNVYVEPSPTYTYHDRGGGQSYTNVYVDGGGQGGYNGTSLTIGEETGRSDAFKFIREKNCLI